LKTIVYIAVLLAAGCRCWSQALPVYVMIPRAAAARVRYGAGRLTAALKEAGYSVKSVVGGHGTGHRIVIRTGDKGPAEGFTISSEGRQVRIDAADASGALYGCLELAAELKKGWPKKGFRLSDHPEMPLRGTCIGLQKTTLLRGRGPYEYPYTPSNFPWFYDKALWIRYLDSMVDNRLNSLYLWNGHPFASLVRLKDYPDAVEVDEETFRKNEEMFRFLTTEADRRGIWVIQTFYNIIVSKPFAEKHHLKTQDRSRHILPVIADYTRKSIAAFVEKYPNVGLMFTLGEAMEGVGQDDIDWLTKTIIPGVLDGLAALGRHDEPPLVLRAHDTDGPADLKAAGPLYRNLYVAAKYNGESLTTYTPRGSWAELNRHLSAGSKGLIANVHILANLEPFRYGADDFIQKCVLAMHNVYGASGLHLYPQAAYWDWPYAADSAQPHLLELERDWIWYKEWARYAWNCHRDRQAEVAYWSVLLAARYGCDTAEGRQMLLAYEQSGEIAPRLLRRFGITDGNRQTLSLGMLMTELIDPQRYGVLKLLYESEGPPGETLNEYAGREWRRQVHEGETPVQVIREVRREGQAAVEAIDRAAPGVTRDKQEFARLRNDMYCYRELADCYAAKAEAALWVLRFKYSAQPGDLEKAMPLLRQSLEHFRELARLAGPAYRYANSMQTPQRKIPVRGTGGKFVTWGELLPVYESELHTFELRLDSLRHSRGPSDAPAPAAFRPADVEVLNGAAFYRPDSGARIFSDSDAAIEKISPVLKDVRAIRLPAAGQRGQGTTLEFRSAKPVDLLIGFFDQKGSAWLPAPQLETDASANDFGQADVMVADGLVIPGFPVVNIHRWSFPPGRHVLRLGKGLCLVMGFVEPAGKMQTYDAGLSDPGNRNIDWLFE